MKKLLSIFLVIAMLVTTCTVATAYYTDIDGHWAEKEIKAWSDYGVINGYDGKFFPNRYMTRGEFAVVLNQLMSYQEEGANVFGDLPDKYYTSAILKLNQAGVMQGYDGLIKPEASITREEASVMICRALGIATADEMNRAFSDEANISDWSRKYLNALVNSGLLNGTDGKLNPKNPIMRSEVVKILDNAVYPIRKAGTFESINTDKILVISAGDVNVKNSEIKGKIIVTQGATEGKVSFTNSKIENSFVIDNDRDSFIEIKDTTVADEDILKDNAVITEKEEETKPSGGGGGGSSGGSGNNGGNQGGSNDDDNTGETTPGTGEITPGTGETTPGTGETTPGTGETTPGTGETTPGTGETPPGTGETTPGTGETTPGTGETTPGTGETTPGTGETTPGTGETTPGTGETTPGTGETTPGTGETTPGTGETTPGTGETTPGTGETTPGTGETTPGTGETTPGTGETTPGTGETTPGTGETTPGTGETTCHNMTFNAEVPATCDEDGTKAHYECSICGKTYEDEAGEVELTDLIIPAVGHSYEEEVTVEPTCTEEGEKTFTCTVCGDTYTETIAALGHTMTFNEQIDATCAEDGTKAHWLCSVCGKTYEDEAGEVELTDLVIPATGHSYGAWEKEDDIKHKKKCSCGEIVREDHVWDEGVITLEPTITTEGEMLYTCTVCNATKTEDVDKLPHIIITVGNMSANAGDEITVPVSISNNEGLAGLDISVAYNSDILSLTDFSKGEALRSLTFTKPKNVSANPIKFIWDGTENDEANGSILLLKFKVAETTITGRYTVNVNVTTACEHTLKDIATTVINGKISVSGVESEETIKVTFYEGYGEDAYDFDEIELPLDSEGKTSIEANDIPSTGYPWIGYKKSDYMPSGYDDYSGNYGVDAGYYYRDNGEWKVFDEEAILTEDTDVYMFFKGFSLSAFGIAPSIRYDENSRLLDSVVSFLDATIPLVEAAKDTEMSIYDELTSGILGMLQNSDLIDADEYIKKIEISLNLSDVMEEYDVQGVVDAVNDGNFEVTLEKIGLLKTVYENLQTITIDEVIEMESGATIASMVSLVGYDICNDIFESAKEAYCDMLDEIIDDVENEVIPSGTLPTELILAFDPIEDIFMPIYEEAEEDVIGEFDSSLYYDDNPYLKYLIEELDMFSELFIKDDEGTVERTGYKMNDIIAYLKYMAKLLIASGDTLYWCDAVGTDYDVACEALLAREKAVNDRIEEVLLGSQYDNLPGIVKKALESVQKINEILLNIEPIFSGDINIQAELKAFVNSGELDSLVDELMNGELGENVDVQAVEDIVEIIENIAEHGTAYYKVPTSNETVISKYELQLGDEIFTLSKYLES